MGGFCARKADVKMPAVDFKEVNETASKRLENSSLGKQLNPENNNSPRENYDKPLGRSDVKDIASSAIQNKLDGCRREGEVADELAKKYLPENGYTIVREQYLRNKDGTIARDPQTGTARRIDFVVMKDGKVVDSVEVTSTTASKIGQSAKELRIRETGGNYVKGSNGELVRVPNSVQTRIERRA